MSEILVSPSPRWHIQMLLCFISSPELNRCSIYNDTKQQKALFSDVLDIFAWNKYRLIISALPKSIPRGESD